MPSKKILERASVLNTASAKRGAIAVVASAVAGVDRKQTLASFKCKHCETTFASNMPEPFCVNCGSMSVSASNSPVEKLPDDQHLSAVVCKTEGCGTFNIVTDETAHILGDRIRCVACGTPQSFELAADADYQAEVEEKQPEPITEADKEAIIDRVEGDKETAADGDDWEEEVEDKQPEPITEAEPDAILEIENKVEAQEGADDEIVEPISDDELLEDESAQGADSDQFDDQDISIEAEGEQKDQQQDVQEQDANKTCMSMLAMVLAQAPKAELQLAHIGDTILAMLNNVHVASLAQADAKDNSKIFTTEAFLNAILHTAKDQGVRKALAHYGFKSVEIKVPLNKVVSALTKKRSAEKAAEFAAKAKTFTDEFKQCLSIAAAGLNKGFFREHDNVLKAAFYEMLTTAGVKRSEKIIDQVFSKYGDSYHKTLFTLATELMQKPVDVRNALSDTIGEVQYQEVDEQDAGGDDGEDQDQSLEQQMESAAVASTKTTRRVVNLSEHSKGKVQEIAIRATANGSKPLFKSSFN